MDSSTNFVVVFQDSEEDEDGGFASEEELPKVHQSKKRPAESAQKTPVPVKKAKSATPDKSGLKFILFIGFWHKSAVYVWMPINFRIRVFLCVNCWKLKLYAIDVFNPINLPK